MFIPTIMLYLNGKINVIIRKLQTLNNPLMISIYQIKIKIGQDTLMLPTPYISCMGGEKMKKNKVEDLTEESGLLAGEITSSKVEVIASIVLTLGYSLSTLATILALQEEEELAHAKNNEKQDQNLYMKQMFKQLQNVNNRLDTIERKLNRY